jgi:hypothetical protein
MVLTTTTAARAALRAPDTFMPRARPPDNTPSSQVDAIPSEPRGMPIHVPLSPAKKAGPYLPADRDIDGGRCDTDAPRPAPAAAPHPSQQPAAEPRPQTPQQQPAATPSRAPKAAAAAAAMATPPPAASAVAAAARTPPVSAGKSPNCARPTTASIVRAQEQQAMRSALAAPASWKF